MKRINRPITYLLVIAIITMAVSPACAFISGNNTWIEICSGDQTKRIKTNSSSDELPDVTDDGCQFCFQHTNMTGLILELTITFYIHNRPHFFDFVHETALIAFHQTYHSRAPPVFF